MTEKEKTNFCPNCGRVLKRVWSEKNNPIFLGFCNEKCERQYKRKTGWKE